MTDPRPNFEDASSEEIALDRLLATAEWPVADEAAARRLAAAVADARRRPARWRQAAALAAVVALAAGVAWFGRPASRPPGRIASVPAPAAVAPPSLRPPSAGVAVSPPVLGRPATALERAIIMAPRPLPVRRIRGVPASRPAPDAPGVDDREAIVRAARDALRPRTGQPVDATVELNQAVRLAAVALPVDWPVVRTYALRPLPRRPTLAALAARRDDASIMLLLRAVLDTSLRSDALAAVKGPGGPPPAAWLSKFDALNMDERWAAAIALGAAADADTLDRLADMAERGEHRREAIAALLASDTPAARVLLARLSPAAASHVGPTRQTVAVLLPAQHRL